MAARKPRLRGWGLGLSFGVFALLEIVVLVRVSGQIGWWTMALLIGTSLLGFFLLQREWRKVWKSLMNVAQTGSWPAGRVTDATLVLLGGVLLILPGLLSDVAGVLLLLPFTRPFIRSGISWWASQVLERSGVSPTVIKGSVVVEEDGGEVTLIPAISQSPSDTEGEADGEVLEGTIISSESPETPGA